MAQPASDTVLIRNYFFKGQAAKAILAEVKKLTDEDKKQLGEALRNGTLTY